MSQKKKKLTLGSHECMLGIYKDINLNLVLKDHI